MRWKFSDLGADLLRRAGGLAAALGGGCRAMAAVVVESCRDAVETGEGLQKRLRSENIDAMVTG